MKRRMVMLLFGMVFALTSVVSCGNNTSSGEGKTSAGGSNQAKESGQSGSDGAKESGKESEGKASGDAEDVPLIRFAANKSSADMDYWPTDYIAQMQKDLGVKIEMVAVSSDQFDLALASRDAAFDVANCDGYREAQVLNANMAVCLDDYLDEYGPNIKKYEDANNLSREFLSNGTGKLYFTRCQAGFEAPDYAAGIWCGYVVRWDWYKELGYPAINNEDEWMDVMEQMLEKHPTNDVGAPTYGIGVANDGWGCWTTHWRANKGIADVVKGLELDIQTGEAFSRYADDRASFWIGMEFANKLYNRGLLDPDAFIMKSDDFKQKVLQGTYAGGMKTWDVGAYHGEAAKKDPNTVAGYMSVLPENGGIGAYYGCSPVAGWESASIFVYSKSPNIEKAVSFLDYTHNEDNMRTFYSGFEGIHWNKDSGKAKLTPEGKDLISQGGDPLSKAGVYSFWRLQYFFPLSFASMHSDGGYLTLFYDPDVIAETLNPMQKDYSDHYNVKFPAQVHMDQVKKGIAFDRKNEPKDLMMVVETPPEELVAIDAKLTALLSGYIPDLVTAPDKAAFDAKKKEVLDACKTAGSDQLYEWGSKTYQEGFEKLSAAKKKYGIK